MLADCCCWLCLRILALWLSQQWSKQQSNSQSKHPSERCINATGLFLLLWFNIYLDIYFDCCKAATRLLHGCYQDGASCAPNGNEHWHPVGILTKQAVSATHWRQWCCSALVIRPGLGRLRWSLISTYGCFLTVWCARAILRNRWGTCHVVCVHGDRVLLTHVCIGVGLEWILSPMGYSCMVFMFMWLLLVWVSQGHVHVHVDHMGIW